MENYYEILGVSETASPDEIKQAYRKLAMQHHPDRNPGDQSAEEKFKKINEAYDTLKDVDKKSSYDYMRKNGGPRQGNFHGGFRGGPPPGFEDFFMNGGFGPGGFMDIEELLRRQRPQRNRDINIQYALHLEEAFFGVEKELTLNTMTGQRKVKVKFPAGVDNGMRIRLQGQGDNTQQNLPAGDMYIHVNMHHHPTYRREGQNLRTFVEINAIDAMLGTEKIIQSIDGNDIKLKIPAGVQFGNSLRVQGKGMPIVNSSGRGDLYVDVHISVPSGLTEAQRKLLEKVKKDLK